MGELGHGRDALGGGVVKLCEGDLFESGRSFRDDYVALVVL